MRKNYNYLRDPENNLPIEVNENEIISQSGNRYKI